MHEVGYGDRILQETREHYGNKVSKDVGYSSKQDFESQFGTKYAQPLGESAAPAINATDFGAIP